MTPLTYPTADELRTHRKYCHAPAADRLAECYVIEPNGCWRWLKGLTSAGYGHLSINRVHYQAHRLMYILHRGPIPTGLTIDHLCRNRACVNPDHLEPVTHQENMRRGMNTILNPEKVVAIHAGRARGLSMLELGLLFGVNRSTICRVLKGQRWPEYVPKRAVA